jgi:hypothetical protein
MAAGSLIGMALALLLGIPSVVLSLDDDWWVVALAVALAVFLFYGLTIAGSTVAGQLFDWLDRRRQQ